MKNFRRILLTVVVAAVLSWAVWLAWPRPEPVYQGRKLSEWLAGYDTFRPEPQHQTDDAIRHLGTNALPVLLRMVRAHDSPLKLKWLRLLQKQHLIKTYHKSARLLNSEAQRAFWILGADASNAVPELMASVKECPSPEVQANAVVALALIGPAAKDAVPLIIPATTNADFRLSGNSVWALGQIHDRPDLAVPALVGLLNSTNTWTRVHVGFQAADSLAKFGPAASPAVPDLVRLLDDPDETFRRHVTNALKTIAPEAAARAGVR